MRLNEIYRTYKDRVEFFLVYIREAHPSDGWQTPQNLYDDIIYAEPTTSEQRAEVAGACQISLDIELPMLIDSPNNDVDNKYIAEPIRLYVIDEQGAITYNGAVGPFGFDPDAWEGAIKETLSASAQAAQ